jgi:hypothetical protein
MSVEDIVMETYADVAVAKVSHMFALTGAVLSEEQRNEMLLNLALTTSMLGLIDEDALISPRLGGLGAKRKLGPTGRHHRRRRRHQAHAIVVCARHVHEAGV